MQEAELPPAPDADAGQTLSFETLEEQHFLAAEWGELVALYERRLASPALRADRAARARLLFRQAQVLEERLGDVEGALARYLEVARLDPGFRPALAQLRHLHAKRGSAELALQVAEHEATLPMRPFESEAFHTEVGALWAGPMGDPGHALQHFEQALACAPGSEAAARGRAEVLAALGRASEAAAAFETLLERLRGAERAPVRVALAALQAGPLGQLERAFENYRRALTDDPRHREALEGVAALAARGERWTLLAELAERRFELAPSAKQRLAVALEAGGIELERLARPQAARPWFRRALEIEPRCAAAELGLAALERLTGRREEAARRLERALEIDRDGVPVARLLEAAELAEERGDAERALGHTRAAVERAPEDAETLGLLARRLDRAGHAEELALVLERQAGLAGGDGARRAALLAELARLHEERLDDPDAALEAYRRAFDADPSLSEVESAIERLLHKAGDLDALRTHLEEACRRVPERDGSRLRCALAELRAGAFGDLTGASRDYEAALARDPGCEAAWRGLERVAQALGDDASLLRAYEREAELTSDPTRLAFLVGELVRRLEARGLDEEALMWAERLVRAAPRDPAALASCVRLQERLGDEVELAASLERLEACLPEGERGPVRRRLADALSRLGEPARALEWRLAALALEPGRLETLEALVEPLERAGRLTELAEVLASLGERAAPGRRREALAALAALRAERLDDAEGALRALRRLGEQPGAADDADARIEEMLERRGRSEELVEHLRERSRRTGGEKARALEQRRAGLLLERLGRASEAADAFRALHEADPTCERAERGLEASLRAAGDMQGLAVLLEERAGRAADPESRAVALLERARILEEALGDASAARRLYEALAETDGDAARLAHVGERLEALLERGGEWEALRDRLVRRLERARPDAARGLHERLARLAEGPLRDLEGAARHLEAVARLAPASAETWQRLAVLYEGLGRDEDLLRSLEAELSCGPAGERELALCIRAGRLCAARPGLAARAERHYARAFELRPSDPEASEFLAQRYEAQGRSADLARLLEARLAALAADGRDAAGELSLRLRLAALRSGPLGDAEGAIALLEPAAVAVEALALAAQPLAALYERSGRREARALLCRRFIAHCDVPAERADWWIRLGLDLGVLGREREAAEALERALADRPGDPVAGLALRELYRRLGESEPLARLLEAELPRLRGAEEIEARLELAGLLGERPGSAEAALGQLRRVLELDPRCSAASDRALALAEAHGCHAEQLALLEARLAAESGPARAALLARKAALLAGPLARAEEAAPVYREVLRLDPGSSSARGALRRVLQDLGRIPELLDLIESEAARADADARPRLLEEGARLAAERVRPDAALPWLERLRAECPGDAGVLRRLAALHRDAGRPAALLRVLESELALDPEPARRRELELERARLLESALGLPLAAAAALESAYAAAPDDLAILRELDRLYAAARRPGERAGALTRLLARVTPGERNPLRRELAQHCLGPLRDPARAAALLEAALAHPGEGDVPSTDLLRELAEAFAADGRREAAARTAERELGGLDPHDPGLAERRVALHQELALRYRSDPADPEGELVHLRALVDGECGQPPTAPPALRAAAEARIIERLRQDRNLVELAARLRRRRECAPDPSEAALAGGEWLELARLEDEQLHRPALAAHAYAEALRYDPGCRAARRGLRGVAERLGDWATVASTLEHEIDGEPSPVGPARAALLRRLGEVAWRQLGSAERAQAAFAAALEADPHDLRALRSLAAVHESREEWQAACDLCEREVELLGSAQAEARQTAWLRAAELALARLEDPARALRAFDAAARVAPLPPTARRRSADAADAVGDGERAARLFAEWCDDPAAGAGAEEHVDLARRLESLGRAREALARAQRALTLDANRAEVWELAARLHAGLGDPVGQAGALERAAGLVGGRGAAQHLREAAAALAEPDAARALECLRRAASADPACAQTRAELTLAAAREGSAAEVEAAARDALELEAAGAALPTALRARVALEGGAAARRVGHLESASVLLRAALELEPENPRALSALAEIALEFASFAEARVWLERRLALVLPACEAADDLTRLGDCLEALGEERPALDHYRQALGADPGLLAAHEGCVRVLDRLDRPGELARALRALARALADTPAEAARVLLRAHGVSREAGEDPAAARADLEEALRLDPALAPAWLALARVERDAGRTEAALETAARGLEHAAGGAERADLAEMRGGLLETAGDAGAAAEAYAEALAADGRRVEAALACARLHRALGEWRAAARVLEQVGSLGDPRAAARALHPLGRLLAGPLEDLDGALRAYERAVECDPGHAESERALADLLVHYPARRTEAIARHRAILARDPLRLASVRALTRLLGDGARAGGLAILAALGAATPDERRRAPRSAPLPSAEGLGDPRFECARRIAQAAAAEIAAALETGPPAIATGADDPVAQFRNRALAAAGELSAPALLPLPTERLRSVLAILAGLGAEAESVTGDGHLVNALAGALNRRARRRIQRELGELDPEALAGLDAERWRAELHALAAARVLRLSGGSLRTALLATLDDASGRPPDEADLSALVAGSPAAAALMGRVVRAWLESL